MNGRKDTPWFIRTALPLSWFIGWPWPRDERFMFLLRVLMCVPAVVGMGCAWFFRPWT